MPKNKIQRPELPRIRRHRWKEAGWLVMEPARIATIAGCFFAGLATLVFFVRQHMGIPMAVGDVLLGVAKAFVVSYVAAGLFVVYLLWIAERELLPPEDPKKQRGLKGDKAAKAAVESVSDDVAPRPETSELDVLTEALERLSAVDERTDDTHPPK